MDLGKNPAGVNARELAVAVARDGTGRRSAPWHQPSSATGSATPATTNPRHPLVAGAGDAGQTDLVLAALDFDPRSIPTAGWGLVEAARQDVPNGVLPLHLGHKASGVTLVGTESEIASTLGLRLASGRWCIRPGEIVAGAGTPLDQFSLGQIVESESASKICPAGTAHPAASGRWPMRADRFSRRSSGVDQPHHRVGPGWAVSRSSNGGRRARPGNRGATNLGPKHAFGSKPL